MKKGLRSRLTKYGDEEFALFLRRGFLKAAGYTDEALDRPVVGILSTASDFNPCHGNAPAIAERIARGVRLAGGLPFAFPTISLHESFSFPTSMLLRNLMAMDTEEMISALPLDAVVLIGGCDKTIPAELMGAVSADMPAIVISVGPMLAGRHEGARLGACTDCRRLWAAYRAGALERHRPRPRARPAHAVGRHLHGDGHRVDHGVPRRDARLHAARRRDRAVGLGRARAASPKRPANARSRWRGPAARGRARSSPAGAAQRLRGAAGDLRLDQRARASCGDRGARRASNYDLDEFDRVGRETPVLVNLKPAGEHFAEDFHAAGGFRRCGAGCKDHLDLSAPTVNGETLGDVVARWPAFVDDKVIRPLDQPVVAGEAIAILKGIARAQRRGDQARRRDPVAVPA